MLLPLDWFSTTGDSLSRKLPELEPVPEPDSVLGPAPLASETTPLTTWRRWRSKATPSLVDAAACVLWLPSSNEAQDACSCA